MSDTRTELSRPQATHAASSSHEAQSKPLTAAPNVHPTATVIKTSLGRYTEVGPRTSLNEVTLGDYSYIVNDGEVDYTTIGNHCSIAAMVRICPGNHPMWRATTCHFTYRASKYWPDEPDDAEFFAWRRSTPCEIGHDVWVGHGAIILAGRKVGNGAVVAAGAVVTRDVPPYAIVAGNPARVVRERFPQAVQAELEAIAFWNWSHDQLRLALSDFRSLSIEQFCEKYRAADPA